MKRILIFILLGSLFACTKETQEVTSTSPQKNYMLSVYSTDSVVTSEIDSLLLLYYPESQNQTSIAGLKELAWGPIELENLSPEKYRFIAIATTTGSLKDLKNYIDIFDTYIRIKKDQEDINKILVGGVLEQDPSSGEIKFELKRLVGGVKININNPDSLPNFSASCYINNIPDRILLGEPKEEVYLYPYFIGLNNKWHYIFPSLGKVKGYIQINYTDENYQLVNKTFDLVSENAIEANKRLELHITLNRKSITKSVKGELQLCLKEQVTNF